MKKIPKTMLIILVIISTLVTITSCVPNRITETKIKSSTERATQVEQKEIETEKAVTEILEKSTEETKKEGYPRYRRDPTEPQAPDPPKSFE